jgi:hypothetical protein
MRSDLRAESNKNTVFTFNSNWELAVIAHNKTGNPGFSL